MVLLPKSLHDLKQVAKEIGLDVRSAYLNLDGDFDSAHNRKCIFNAGMIPGSVPITCENSDSRHSLISLAVILDPSYGYEELLNGLHALLLS
jgi:hypothetical protein